MRCEGCRAERVDEAARFCNSCGTPFSSSDADVGEAETDGLDDLASTMLMGQVAGSAWSETARRDAGADGPIAEAIVWADADDQVDPDGMERGPVTDPTPIELVRSWEPRAMPTEPVSTVAPRPASPPPARDTTEAGPARLRPTVMTTVGVLLTGVVLLGFTLDLLRISTTAPADLLTAARSTGFRIGTWHVDDLASNLGLTGLIIAVLAAIGAVGTVLGRAWGAGMIGGSGLSAAGVAALAIGLVEQPVGVATRFAELGASEAFTVTIERPLGYWMLLATVAAGVVTFFASVNEIFRDRRHDLNPLIGAVGALAVVGAGLGPLRPSGGAAFADNWMVGSADGAWPTLLVIARLIQVGALAVGGVL
ncbi:MAG: hypothetical protein ISQ15_08230, partial [Ilumatobacteraceae bacterium]|nr:hypothetical protein [Ilumatobacteraceae bacterium]